MKLLPWFSACASATASTSRRRRGLVIASHGAAIMVLSMTLSMPNFG